MTSIKSKEASILDNICPFYFGGPCDHMYANLAQVIAPNMQELCYIARIKGPGKDIIEICGGEALASQIAVRRRLDTGPNFDLITQCDLTDPYHQRCTMDYITSNKVLVAVMAPACGPFGPLGVLNEKLYPEAMARAYEAAAPLAHFCGQVAQHQLDAGMHPCKSNNIRQDFMTRCRGQQY